MMRRLSFLVIGLLLVLGSLTGSPLGAAAPRRPTAHVQIVHVDIQVTAFDDVIVRRMHAPTQFDDKGKARNATAEELKQLKGDHPNMNGYQAEFSDLAVGSAVHVVFGRTSDKLRDAPAAKAPAKSSDSKLGDSDKKETTTAAHHKVGEIEGIISKVDTAKKHFTLRVDSATLTTGRSTAASTTNVNLTAVEASRIYILATPQSGKK
jgi:hypothetical protein